MDIPVGFAQVNFVFGGTACPTGAQCAFGIKHTEWPNPKSDIPAKIELIWDQANGLRSFTNSRVVLQKIRVKLGPNLTGAFYEVAVNEAGDQDRLHSVPNVSHLISKLSDLGGKNGRGRTFWPGVAENDVLENGDLTANRIAEMQTAFDNFRGTMQIELLPLQILHELPVPFPTPITNMVCQTRTATQRRRLRRT